MKFCIVAVTFLSLSLGFDGISGATHGKLNEDGEIRFSFDSPNVIRQSHSLADLFLQVELITERNNLQSIIKKQQKVIEKRYNEDDPEVERKVRETDPHCIRSKSLDLQTENFIVSYGVDLVPSEDNMKNQRKLLNPSMASFYQIFSTEQWSRKKQEPICEDYMNLSDEEADVHAEFLPSIVDPELDDFFDEQRLHMLGSFLTDRLEEGKSQHLALYYSAYYWSITGNSRNAAKCLLRFLEEDPDSNPAKFQLGMLYIRVGKYSEAIKLLESVTKNADTCADCSMALGDAYVLDGNFPSAIVAYGKANRLNPELEIGKVKRSLLQCILKVFEVMENQHTNLLDTIEDVNDYKEKMARLKSLGLSIERLQASSHSRDQGWMAYNFYRFGPMPHLICEGVRQRLSKHFDVERLQCSIDDIETFNREFWRRIRLAEELKRGDDVAHVSLSVLYDEEMRTFLRNSKAATLKFVENLTPFMTVRMDQPQVEPWERSPSPLNAYLAAKALGRPSRLLCKGLASSVAAADPFDVFLSPLHKGFLVSELLNKYLALSVDELSPLPWRLPLCGKMHVATVEEAEEDRKIFNLESVAAIFRDARDVYPIGDQRLKRTLASILFATSADDLLASATRPYAGVSVGDVGNRVAAVLKYRIGAEWIGANLAALHLRYLGIYREALTCLRVALKTSPVEYKDVALAQVVQIMLHYFVINTVGRTSAEQEFVARIFDDANAVFSRIDALKGRVDEPLIQLLRGALNELVAEHLSRNARNVSSAPSSSDVLTYFSAAKRHYTIGLRLDPRLAELRQALLRVQCEEMKYSPDGFSYDDLRDSDLLIRSVCCPPYQQNVYCFKKLISPKRQRASACKLPRPGAEPTHPLCYTLKVDPSPPFKIDFIHQPCGQSGRRTQSERPPGLAVAFLLPFIISTRELRRRHAESVAKAMMTAADSTDATADDEDDLAMALKNTPMFPLDHGGGYSEERVQHFWSKIPKMDDPGQFSITFGGPEEEMRVLSPAGAHAETSSRSLRGKNASESASVDVKLTRANEELTSEKNFAESARPAPPSLPPLSTVQNRIDVLDYDIDLPGNVPEPLERLVRLGEQHFRPPDAAQLLGDYCGSYRKDKRILEQPVSTYVSVTAKGIQIDDYLDLATPIGVIRATVGQTAEPVCPNPTATSKLLEEFDLLPAYKYRHQLKFYWPEKALRDALQSLGHQQHDKMKMEEVAARLAYAMRPQRADRVASGGGDVDWTLSTASTLYWRVKGDAVNAIKCLRHSLHNSPDEMKDVALISMANIYHQAGFLRSALLVGGRALDISPDSVVAIHFTLANIYVSMGDYYHALKFYHSTLALQSKFEVAKERIRAIHCQTDGKYLR